MTEQKKKKKESLSSPCRDDTFKERCAKKNHAIPLNPSFYLVFQLLVVNSQHASTMAQSFLP